MARQDLLIYFLNRETELLDKQGLPLIWFAPTFRWTVNFSSKIPQTTPSQAEEEEAERGEDGWKDLGFKGQSACKCGSSCCSTAAESAAFAQLTQSPASAPEGWALPRIGVGPAWTVSPGGELLSEKGQEGVGLLRRLAERSTLSGQPSPQV